MSIRYEYIATLGLAHGFRVCLGCLWPRFMLISYFPVGLCVLFAGGSGVYDGIKLAPEKPQVASSRLRVAYCEQPKA